MIHYHTPERQADDRPSDTQGPITVRLARPEDGPQIERLLNEGRMPGHVDHASDRAEEVLRTLGAGGRDRFWVAEADGRIVGTLALIEAERDVGHLHWLRVDPAWQAGRRVARALRRVATAYAREVGLIKLVLHMPKEAEQRVVSYYQRLGFQFSRARDTGGVHVLEFYVNLYQRPAIGRDGTE